MGFRVLFVENQQHLQLYLDNLKVDTAQGTVLFPISDIQILIIDQYKSTLTVPLLNKLTENHVCIVICGIDHLPKSYVLPINGHFAQSGNIMKQIQWNDCIKQQLHQYIVKAKIQNQLEILKTNHCNQAVIEKLTEFRKTVELGDQTNREGLSAKMYFREMFGDEFIRFDDDVINAGLNYGYSIFRSLISSIIVGKGYLPNLGIFHKGKTNMFNFSDDIIEVFRPIVDQYVYMNMKEELLFKSKHREELIQLATMKIEMDGRLQTVSNAIGEYIECILKVIELNDISYFKFPLPFVHKYDL
ncbi:type II CRISPR-associated endonuclease Cas1 [Massilicoli timonensis]|uniref:type II CRISPR-associated endonuclease Cas1 n=1 Tax=Massilicoli timonensis TaxID=2015901 RepID=UPI000C83652F|nr:type II CRISPR-associated endonuclease Cas1 [Massilicoli timonensis]